MIPRMPVEQATWCSLLITGWLVLWFTQFAKPVSAFDDPVAGNRSASESVIPQSHGELSSKELAAAMQLTSQAFRLAAKRVEPSLVTIESFGGAGTTRGKIGGIRKQGEGNTTGVVISTDGYIVTSTFSFIEQPSFFSVIPSDGKRRIAKLIGRDDTRKICLLKIEEVVELPVPEMVLEDSIRVGQWALSLGVGYGDASPALSMGIISAKNRIGARAIQTDANISPANYGGPLIDIEGRILGICVPMNPQSQAVGAGVEWYDSGIGFAIPLGGADELINRLKRGEHIQPAFLGLQVAPDEKGRGLRVEKIVADSAVEKAGLKDGDRITHIDGQQVDDVLRLRQILNRFEAGQDVKIKILTAGDEVAKSISVTLGVPPRPKDELPTLEPPQIR